MPQIGIEYSLGLGGRLDLRRLALRIHERLAELAGADIESCKTRLLPLGEIVIGDGAPAEMVHVGIAILSGRSEEQKNELADAVLADLAEAVRGIAGDTRLTVEIRDMDRETYRKRSVGGGG